MLYQTKEQYRDILIDETDYVDMKKFLNKLDISMHDYKRFINGNNESMSMEDLDLILTGLRARPILSNLTDLLMLKKIQDMNKKNHAIIFGRKF